MLRWIWIGLGAVVVILIVGIVWMMQGPDVKPYLELKNPRITRMPDMKVIEITVSGDIKNVLGPAFGMLMKTYYSTKGAPKRPQHAPRLRMKVTATEGNMPTTAQEWEAHFKQYGFQGQVAMPVPDAVTQLPVQKAPAALQPSLTTWTYGQVAEILHVGPYELETPTILKLREFILAQGYVIAGDHEEEYVRGPGMPWVKPADYYTIIRYPVKKAE